MECISPMNFFESVGSCNESVILVLHRNVAHVSIWQIWKY